MVNIFEGLDNSKDASQRDYCSMCVFGDLGRGKSTFLIQLAKMYQEQTKGKKIPRRILICDPSNAAAFNHFPRITLTQLKYGVINPKTSKATYWDNGGVMVLRDVKWNNPEWFEVITKYFRNGLLILDESRNYIPQSSEMAPELKELFTIHRNNCLDVVVVSHDFMNMNLWLRKAFRYYIVFRTGDKPNNEAWFTTRTLPEELWPIWKTLQNLRSPSAKISPFIVYDKETGRKRLYADESRLEVVIHKDGVQHQIPYAEYQKMKKK